MVCCTLLSMLFAAALWPGVQAKILQAFAGRDPLAWRPHGRAPVEMPQPVRPTSFTLLARLKSFAFAVEGLRFMLRNEHNAWIHLTATGFIIVAGLALRINGPDWRWISVAVLWVWFAEAMNTAFEHLCDVFSPGPNEPVRVAKDIAAGAVLLSAVEAVILGAITLTPYIAILAAGSKVDFAICGASP